MNNIFEKSIGLLNNEQLSILNNSLIILFGLGGVGGYTFESLVRVGIENFAIIDKDKFELTNLNRQLASTNTSIDKYKVDIYCDRAKSINGNIKILPIIENVTSENIDNIFIKIFNNFNNKNIFVIDCIDDANAKISIIKYCKNNSLNIFSCMGTANHISSKNIKIDKISKTKYCPLAKKIRSILKNENIYDIDCLYIEEEPILVSVTNDNGIRHTSTISYIPAIAGLKIAEYVINKIIN